MIQRLKAWHKTEKRMLPVLCIDFAGTEIQKGTPCIVAYENDGCYPLDEVELVLSTGKQDVHENEVYEGDIVEFKVERIFDLNDYTTECNAVAFGYGVVEWFAPEFRIKKFKGLEFYDYMGEKFGWDELRVVGNVYENPELLEVK